MVNEISIKRVIANKKEKGLFVPTMMALMGTTTTNRAQRKQLNMITRSPCTRSSAYSRFPRFSISVSRVQKMASLDVQVATKHAASVCPN